MPDVSSAGDQIAPVVPAMGADVPGPVDLSAWGMFTSADHVVQAVMIGLLAASIVSWAIGLAKMLEISAARRSLVQALARAAEARSLDEIRKVVALGSRPEAMLVAASLAELRQSEDVLTESVKTRIDSRLARVEHGAARHMAQGTGILASIGATAPFIGLFGTVWGIMNAFIGIAQAHTTNLAVVAPGIAQALLATGLGLFAAIPAVVIYNVLARRIRGYRGLLGDFSAEIARHASRDLDRYRLRDGRGAE